MDTNEFAKNWFEPIPEIKHDGMTRREIVALVAMHGMLSAKTENEQIVSEILALSSFGIADAMIRESEKDVCI